jgi:hypothetical protein
MSAAFGALLPAFAAFTPRPVTLSFPAHAQSPRSRPVVAVNIGGNRPWERQPSSSGNFTIGDALLGSLSRQLDEMPERDHLKRAERTLDAMLDSSFAEIDALKDGLDRDLHWAALNTTIKLQAGMRRTEAFYESAFAATEAALDEVIAPTRESVRRELQRHQDEHEAVQEARRRRALNGRANGFARCATWRSLPRAAERPKHPVVLVCEACSVVLSLMLLLGAADLASAQHRVAAPPRIASVQMRSPQRTFEYTDDVDAATAAVFRAQEDAASASVSVASFYSALVAAAAESAEAPAAAGAPVAPHAGSWWAAARGVFFVWLVSFGVILLNAGNEEWAALALGISPCRTEGGAGGAAGKTSAAGGTGFIRWEYDWERDAWREVS